MNDFWSETTLQKATVQTTATTEMKRKLQLRQPRPARDRTIETLGGTQHNSRKTQPRQNRTQPNKINAKTIQYERKLKNALTETTQHKTTAKTTPQLGHNRREPQQLPHRNISELQPRPQHRKT